MEAMASGLPVVAAESGPTCEQIKNHHTGLLYNPNDPDDFKKTLLQFEDEILKKTVIGFCLQGNSEMGWDEPGTTNARLL